MLVEGFLGKTRLFPHPSPPGFPVQQNPLWPVGPKTEEHRSGSPVYVLLPTLPACMCTRISFCKQKQLVSSAEFQSVMVSTCDVTMRISISRLPSCVCSKSMNSAHNMRKLIESCAGVVVGKLIVRTRSCASTSVG